MYSTELAIKDGSEKNLDLLPTPSGYHILIAMPVVESKTKGGVFVPEEFKRDEQTASICGYVMKVGPDAYQNKDRYPNGPWCKEGDWVIFRSYSGTRFKIKGQEFRLINDDTIDGVVSDPKEYSRA